MSQTYVLDEIGQLVTLRRLAEDKRVQHIKEQDLDILTHAYIAVENGVIKAVGQGPVPAPYKELPRLHAGHRLVMPAFVDCHTHPAFAGDRSDEFKQRLSGATYQDIAKSGGGIKKTVSLTRKATLQTLTQGVKKNLLQMRRFGTLSVEAKSGYGLDPEHELNSLRAIKNAAKDLPMTIYPTCLALHAHDDALPKSAMIQQMTQELLPKVKEEGLALAVDAFIEHGFFNQEEIKPYLAKAKELGFAIRLHVDEFSDQGGAKFCADIGAQSADHLEWSHREGIEAMAEAHTTAVLLPGTSLYAKIRYTNAQPFLEAGCPLALASDFNPGSCTFMNMSFISFLGALNCGLNLEQTLAAVTYVPAQSLGLLKKGALCQGMDADFLVFDCETPEQWLAAAGQTPIHQIFSSLDPFDN